MALTKAQCIENIKTAIRELTDFQWRLVDLGVYVDVAGPAFKAIGEELLAYLVAADPEGAVAFLQTIPTRQEREAKLNESLTDQQQ